MRSNGRRGAAFPGRGIGGIFFCALLLVPGCALRNRAASSAGGGKPQTGLSTAVITINSAAGPVQVEAELARTEAERTTGLMFRTSLEDGRGMLFIFDRDEVLSFWMKNTLIPLSIAYIAYDGTITDIRDMYPGDLRGVGSSRSVRYALEAPQGWFGRAGIRTGDRVILP
jgi:uncharacterized membrane protein (UPF0127 family)